MLLYKVFDIFFSKSLHLSIFNKNIYIKIEKEIEREGGWAVVFESRKIKKYTTIRVELNLIIV